MAQAGRRVQLHGGAFLTSAARAARSVLYAKRMVLSCTLRRRAKRTCKNQGGKEQERRPLLIPPCKGGNGLRVF